MEPRKRLFSFSALGIFFLGTTLVWLWLDRSPPAWDDSGYLTVSLRMYDALSNGGVVAFASKSLTIMDFRPPLISLLPAPIYLITGRHPRAAFAVNLVFMGVMFAALYRIARQYSSPVGGLLAVYTAGTMPMIYGLSRWFLAECGLIALVCTAICLLSEFDDVGRTGRAILLGVTCGLGLLMKMSFPFYVLAPAVYLIARSDTVRAGGAWLNQRTVLAIGIPAGLIALPWYVFNFRHAVGHVLKAGSADAAKAYATGDIFSLDAIWAYLINLLNTGPTLYFVALVVFVAVAFRSIGPAAKKGVVLCAWWGLPVLFLVFGNYRDLRWAAPLLPALAIALSIFIDSVLHRPGAKPAALLLLALPLASMLQGSFHLFGKGPLELGGLLLVVPRFSYARAYDRVSWPHQELLSDIGRLGTFPIGEKRTLMVGTDTLHFNSDIFRLAVVRMRLPLDVTTSTNDQDLPKLLRRLESSAYFVFKDGGVDEASPFNTLGNDALKFVRASRKFMELPIARRLPDGGVARVFVQLAANRPIGNSAFISAGLDGSSACEVTFGDQVQLAGLSFQRSARGLLIRYRWRCLKPVERDYLCFSHIVDDRGNTIRNLDHRIADGRPPISDWKPGDVAVESLFVPDSEISSATSYRLVTGLYHLASGERLPIVSSSLPLTENNTAAIVKEQPDGQ